MTDKERADKMQEAIDLVQKAREITTEVLESVPMSTSGIDSSFNTLIFGESAFETNLNDLLETFREMEEENA